MGVHGIYKYVGADGRILYIGKTHNTFISRMNGHARESKFKPFLESCSVYVHECNNGAED